MDLFQPGKETHVYDVFSKIHEFIKNLEELIIPLTCLIFLGWTAYELIKKKIGFWK